MTIAVTGATGHLGGGVIEELLKLGTLPEDIVPIVRSAAKGAAFVSRGMSPRVASYEDPHALKDALAGLDKIVIVSPPELDNAVRVRLLQNVVLASHDVGIEHVVYSGLAAPQKQAFGLEDVELAIEYLIRSLGLPFTFVRNAVYFDELQGELEVAANSGELLSATDGQPLNWVLRRDMAAATAAILYEGDHLSKTYELTADQTFTYDDLATSLSESIGRPVTHRLVDSETVVSALVKGGMDPAHASGMVKTFQAGIAERKFTDENDVVYRLAGRPTDPAASLRGLRGLAS